MAGVSNKAKMAEKMVAKMPMVAGIAGISDAKPQKPTSISFDIKVEKKKVDGTDGVHFTIRRMGGMDEKDESYSNVAGALKCIEGKLNEAHSELGGKTTGKKEEVKNKENDKTYKNEE